MQVWSKHELISGPRAPHKHCTEGIPKRNPSPDVKNHSPDSRIQAIKAVKPTDQVRMYNYSNFSPRSKVVVVHSCVAVIQWPPPGHTMTDVSKSRACYIKYTPLISYTKRISGEWPCSANILHA